MRSAPSSGGRTLAGITTEPMAPRSTRMTTTIATVRKAATTARPPPRGTGLRLTRRGVRAVDEPERAREAPDAGVRTSARSAADANATTSAGTIAPTPGTNFIRPR